LFGRPEVGQAARVFPLLEPLDSSAAEAARARQSRLTKPPGALGRLEDIGEQLSAIAGVCPPPVPAQAVVAVFAADHGVALAGVTPWPQEVTAQMVANFAGGGAAVNVFANAVGARVIVVDVGVATPIPGASAVSTASLRRHAVRAGTADLSVGPAMSVGEARAAVAVGLTVARELVADGADLLVTGEMGIGNTTASAALIGSLANRSADACTGRGTGIDDATLARKTDIVAAAIARTHGAEPMTRLADIGGLEIAALAGFIIGGAAARVPVLLDGVITLAAAMVAESLVPGVVGSCIAGHRSTEPAATIALDALGLSPLVDLGLRLGEGSGAVLAIPLVQAAAAVLSQMATFDDAGVSEA
jgi:nicotinate-nucleotide--dimethylbenzimidazole phosphoribosyltransferase